VASDISFKEQRPKISGPHYTCRSVILFIPLLLSCFPHLPPITCLDPIHPRPTAFCTARVGFSCLLAIPTLLDPQPRFQQPSPHTSASTASLLVLRPPCVSTVWCYGRHHSSRAFPVVSILAIESTQVYITLFARLPTLAARAQSVLTYVKPQAITSQRRSY